jgi:archaemetzincin
VFGEADLERRVAVYSLVRFQPQFDGKPLNPATRRQALRRSVQLLAHETSHVFGLLHCTKNECVMNGSNSLDESDRAPVHLCPMCLRKLAHAVGFDVVARYGDLYAFYAAHGLTDEARWLKTRLARLSF